MQNNVPTASPLEEPYESQLSRTQGDVVRDYSRSLLTIQVEDSTKTLKRVGRTAVYYFPVNSSASGNVAKAALASNDPSLS